MNAHMPPDPDTRRRFLDRLPWYLNGSLAPDERAWMDTVLREAPWAAADLAREQALERETARQVEAAVLPAAGDLGLARLLARARETPAAAAPPWPRARAHVPAGDTWLHRLSRRLAQPPYALAAVAVVVTQTVAIAWLAREPGADTEGLRSSGVTEMRTLRVGFVADATEVRIRAALLAAGARVVGGPNQLGEYWIASSMKSLDEVKAALQASGLAASIETDLAGPRGQ